VYNAFKGGSQIEFAPSRQKAALEKQGCTVIILRTGGGMTKVGEPQRIVIVEPLDDPVPKEAPHEPERPAQPAGEPEQLPADRPQERDV
jgi:hypothetical protein